MDKEDFKTIGISLLLVLPLCILNGIIAGLLYWLLTTA